MINCLIRRADNPVYEEISEDVLDGFQKYKMTLL